MRAGVVAIVIALGVLALRAAPTRAQGLSPGPLARDHAGLSGVDDCLACHTSGDAIGASKCLGCHVALGARIAAGDGYHPRAGKDCARCHPDHRGADVPLVRWPGGDRDAFDHAKLADFPLAGAHAKQACKGCHRPALHRGPIAAKLTAEERPRTFLGLEARCTACHVDPHKPSLGAACETCHDADAWSNARATGTFDYQATSFPLRGAHAKVDCTGCHGGTTAKLADLHPRASTCASCHKDPHAGAMGAAAACATCHTEAAWATVRFDKARHAPKTFPLVGGHKPPPCARCHGAQLAVTPARACVGCHADTHQPSLGKQCEGCHQVTGWSGKAAKPKAGFHDRTAFPLEGLHETVACAKCHDPKRPAKRRFRPLPHDRCEACHADPHLGEASTGCAGCHDLTAPFALPTFERADHARTDFPLEGGHAATACARCHPAAPASPGFARGAPACEACHADPHAGQFAGRGGCADCHAVAAWAPSRFDRAAHARTRLPLDDAHDVACARCHPAATPAAATRFVGLPADCGACHAEPHLGQFQGRACATCHAGAEFAPTVGFDHAATSMPLRGRHAAAACESCHPTLGVLGAEATIYRLPSTARACTGCHAAQHGDAASPRAARRALATQTTACGACHDEASWDALAARPTFDHAVTGAPLVGGHARAPCGACHQPTRRRVGALEDCSACHADRHRGTLGDRCERCHSAASWKPDTQLVDHERTRLPLVGAHAVQGCPTCHVDAAAGDFRGLSPRCEGCHAGTVLERRPHPPHTGGAFVACERCHSTLAWRPASFDHDPYWPLTGRHTTTACAACHTNPASFAGTPTACADCHQDDLVAADFDHAGVDASRCDRCHTTSGWVPADFPDHDRVFPLRGDHDAPCATCHTTPGMTELFTCFGCHAHDRGETDSHHDEVGGYVYASTACYRCHPRGDD